MTGATLLSRARMALAELGLSEDIAQLRGKVVGLRSGNMTPEQRWLMRCTVDASTPPICLPCWLRTEATGRSLRLPLAERLDCMTLAAEQCGSFRLFDRDDCGAGRVVNVHAAVARLNQIAAEESHDPETAHRSADAVLLAVAAPEVREAYELVGSSCGRWWFA